MNDMQSLYMISLMSLVVVVAAILAFGFVYEMMKAPKDVAGKKDIYTRVFFLFSVIAVLAIVSALSISGVVEKALLGQIIIMLVTALGVKKIDDSTDK